MGVKIVVSDKEKEKGKSKVSLGSNVGSSSSSRSKMKLWMVRATTSVLLWTCFVQLTTLGDIWGPRVLKGWPSCFSQESAMDLKLPSAVSARPRFLPPKSELLLFILVERIFGQLVLDDLCTNILTACLWYDYYWWF